MWLRMAVQIGALAIFLVTIVLDYWLVEGSGRILIRKVLLVLGVVALGLGVALTWREEKARENDKEQEAKAVLETVNREVEYNLGLIELKTPITTGYQFRPDPKRLSFVVPALRGQSFASVGLALVGSRLGSVNALGADGKDAVKSI